MSSWQLGLDLIATFLLAAGLLFYYGNWYRHAVFTTLLVLVAWYFSFIIVLVLPIDISATTYQHCINNEHPHNATGNSTVTEESETECMKPASFVQPFVLERLWRVVYWSSQCLTWLLLPMVQSYQRNGEFTFKKKFVAALKDNALYYGLYLFICLILLIYLFSKLGWSLDFDKLKAIAASAGNSWGLFLLVFMLGHGLVAVPQTLYLGTFSKSYSLEKSYFQVAKLSQERNTCEENLEDVLEALQLFLAGGRGVSSIQREVAIVESLIPTDLKARLERQQRRHHAETHSELSLSALVKVHKQLKKSIQAYHRVECQYAAQVKESILLEDIQRNETEGLGRFHHTIPGNKGLLSKQPTIEYHYRLHFIPLLRRVLTVTAFLLSGLLIWSEALFFVKTPILSVFALFLSSTRNYVAIELLSTITIAYLCACAFYTLSKIRVWNLYYLAGGHNTDEYSLVFCGMLLCRLTPPLCLNVISLFHLDSHVVAERDSETSYTRIMGHMDVLSLISDGFTIYFPVGILLVSLLTYFRIGSRLLSCVGIAQFLEEDEVSEEMKLEGRELVAREKRRLLRLSGGGVASSSSQHQQSRPQPYYEGIERRPTRPTTTTSPPLSTTTTQPITNLFDDV